MGSFNPADPEFGVRVRASVARQAMMTTLGATVERVAPDEVDIRLPFRADLTQQHGFVQAGAMTAVVDSACEYAALSLMPAGANVDDPASATRSPLRDARPHHARDEDDGAGPARPRGLNRVDLAHPPSPTGRKNKPPGHHDPGAHRARGRPSNRLTMTC